MIARRTRARATRAEAATASVIDDPPPEVGALVAALHRAAEDGDRTRFDRLFEHVFARIYTWAWWRSGGEKERAERLAEAEIVRLTVEADEEADVG